MKIKIIAYAYVSAIATMPFMHAGLGHFERMAGLTLGNPQWDCYEDLSGGHEATSADDPLLRAVKDNFDTYNTVESETLIQCLASNDINDRERDIAKWILTQKRGYSTETIQKAVLEINSVNGDLSDEEALKLALAITKDSDASERVVPSIHSEDQGTSTIPNSESHETDSENPYFGKTLEALLAMLDTTPGLNDDILFRKALNKLLGGNAVPEVEINMDRLAKLFPLNQMLDKTCDFDYFKTFLATLSSKKSTVDKCTIPRMESFLEENGLTAIITPGLGNCAFDAVLLSWFYREGLYEPKWNAILGTYLETFVGDFRKEIAATIESPNLKSVIQKKYEYVDQEVFSPIAKKLKSTIILLYWQEVPAQKISSIKGEIFTPDGDFFTFENSEAIKIFLAENQDALPICFNGKNHYVAVRKK